MKKNRQYFNLFLITSIVIAGCQTNTIDKKIEDKKQSQVPLFFVAIYTPERIFLDSLIKDDSNLEESYSDCVDDMNKIIKYSESKQLKVVTTNKVSSVINGISVNFEIQDLCAVALCNQDSIYIIRTPTLEDFLTEYNKVK